MQANRECEVCGGERFRVLGMKVEHRFTRCDDCGLERIDPPPTDETLAAVYGAHYYDAWGLRDDEEAVERLKLSTFSRVIEGAEPLPRGAKILDCGAATGFLMRAAESRGYEPYGVEFSDYGAEKIAERFGEGRVFKGELEHATFADARPGDFRAVFMCDFLEHVRSPEAVLKKAFTLLAPGGVLGITMPRVGSITHRVMGLSWSHYKVEHLYYFSDGSLRRLVERLGFTQYRVRPLRKTMNLRYIAHQFSVYPHPLITPVTEGMRKVLPKRAQHASFPVAMGELLAYAVKP